MLKRFSLIVFTLVMLSSCVSTKVYSDMEDKMAIVKKENRALVDTNADLLKDKNTLQTKLAQVQRDYEASLTSLQKNYDETMAKLQKDYDETLANRNELQIKYDTTTADMLKLQASYDALEYISGIAIAQNSDQNRELLEQLETKEQTLTAEKNRLLGLEAKLESRTQLIAELERVIAAKDAQMTLLKNELSKALTNFEGKGLTVEQHHGKVYVSMENKLLFESGSWAVGKKGKLAVKQLGEVLAANSDIAILIEGHTDNVPYEGSSQLSGNWDLSSKRATAIVNLLRENSEIRPENLTAAGRGEYAPVASNDTAEGKAKNRRIEVILTPKLDKISKLLNEI